MGGMSPKTLGLGAVIAGSLITVSSIPILLPVAGLAWVLLLAVRAVASPRHRNVMVVSGIVVAGLVAGDLAFGHDIMLVGFPGFLAAYALLLPLEVNAYSRSVEIAVVSIYWVMNTAVLGGFITRLRRHRKSLATTAVILSCALATHGCLTDTPPKTPNQRDAERNAPVVAVPPPPDAGRTPRPAPQ